MFKSEHKNSIEDIIKQQNNAIVIKFIVHIKWLYYWKRSLEYFIQLRDYNIVVLLARSGVSVILQEKKV